jgi:hypothetical protein
MSGKGERRLGQALDPQFQDRQRRPGSLGRYLFDQCLAGAFQRGGQDIFREFQTGKKYLDPGQVFSEEERIVGFDRFSQEGQVVAGIADAFQAPGMFVGFPDLHLEGILQLNDSFSKNVPHETYLVVFRLHSITPRVISSYYDLISSICNAPGAPVLKGLPGECLHPALYLHVGLYTHCTSLEVFVSLDIAL